MSSLFGIIDPYDYRWQRNQPNPFGGNDRPRMPGEPGFVNNPDGLFGAYRLAPAALGAKEVEFLSRVDVLKRAASTTVPILSAEFDEGIAAARRASAIRYEIDEIRTELADAIVAWRELDASANARLNTAIKNTVDHLGVKTVNRTVVDVGTTFEHDRLSYVSFCTSAEFFTAVKNTFLDQDTTKKNEIEDGIIELVVDNYEAFKAMRFVRNNRAFAMIYQNYILLAGFKQPPARYV